MAERKSNLIGMLVTAFMFALYSTLPSIGAVSMLSVCIRFTLYLVVCIAVVWLIYKVMEKFLPKLHASKIEMRMYEKWSCTRFFLIIWGILLICWLPAYLAYFPGIFGYDSPRQMQQIMGEIPYESHHPLMHTLFLGLFMNTGKLLFGNCNGGVALFCITQGLAVTASISSTFLLFRKVKVPFWILLAALLWCAWNPVLHVLTFNTTKDILFGVCFLHFAVNLYQWISASELKGLRQMIWLLVSGIFMCLFRNQGIYIVIILFLFSVFMCRKDRRLLLSLAGIILVSQLFFSFTNNVLGVEKGDSREALSVPMQQLGLVCKLYMDGEAVNLTHEEFEKFTNLVDSEHLAGYSMWVSDPIKSYFKTDVLKTDLSEYVQLYISVGMRNPGQYMTALRCLIYPYWDMSKNLSRDISITNTFPEITQNWGITQESLLPGYKEYLSDYILHKMDEKIPFLSWILQPGVCIWILTGLLGLSISKKDKALFLTVLNCMLFFATLLLGPVALLRYIYPLMLLTPWLFALLCWKISG